MPSEGATPCMEPNRPMPAQRWSGASACCVARRSGGARAATARSLPGLRPWLTSSDTCALLRDFHVPENRRSEPEDIADVLSACGRLNPFSPRHIRAFAERDLLDLVGELLPFGLICRAHPFGHKLLELRDIRPAEPGARARARQTEVDSSLAPSPAPRSKRARIECGAS